MFRLKASNFRALQQLDFSPSGVCLLVGPNGAGKTTLLRLLRFLRVASLQNIPNGLRSIGGLVHLRSISAEPDALVSIESSVGDVTWQITVNSDQPGYYSGSSETVIHAGNVLAKRSMGEFVTHLQEQSKEDEQRSSLKLLVDLEDRPELRPLTGVLNDIRVYHPCGGIATFGRLREGMFAVGEQADLYLSPLYDNAFTVLRNWRDQRKYQPQFDRVMEDLRALFPKDFYALEFQPKVGVFRPGQPDRATPIQNMSDGFVAALMHLCAAAGTRQNGLLAIDQIEDNLHPAAIAGLVRALRRWAVERQLTVVLTTHSPYVLDLFDDCPDQVYVMEPNSSVLPVRLTELHDPAWLGHFRLGDLYGVEFARQSTSSDDNTEA